VPERGGRPAAFLPRGLPTGLRPERYAEHRRRVDLGPGRPAIGLIDCGPERPEGSLILVHGYAGCAETWARQIRAFKDRHRVLAPDLRGHGQSGPGADCGLAACRDDLARLLTAVDPPRPWTLVGHSWGGCVAASLAAGDGDGPRPDAVALVSTPLRFAVPWSTRWIAFLPTWGHRYWWPLRPRWNAGPPTLKAMYRQGLAAWDGRAVLPRVQGPCLAVVGGADRDFPGWVYDPAALPPRARRLVIPGAGHKLQLERARELNAALADLMAEAARSAQRSLGRSLASVSGTG
jgi:pimeloyl-ACP methyl ester carboxylesterase